jgi:hypothetical protein
MLKSKIKLFITAFFRVFFVSANTYFIANLFWIGIIGASFLISFLWCINVKKISISTMKERLIYSFGAMFGGVTGVIISKIITQI